MEKLKDKSKDLDTLNKFSLNQFVIKCRPISSQGKVHVLKKLLQHAKRYRQKKTKKDEEKEKNSRKADRFIQEVMFMKKLHPDDITKFSLLNKKTFKKVGDDPKSSIEERALCRLAEHKSVSAAIDKFRNKYPEWDSTLSDIIKGLGLRHRKEKLKRLKEKGKMDTYLEKEQNSLKILQQVGVLKLEKKILDHGDKRTQISNSKIENDLKNRPFNKHSQNNESGDSNIKPNHYKEIYKTKMEDNEEISDEGLGSSEEQPLNKSTGLHLKEKDTDSEKDIMVAKLGQNLKKSANIEEASESEGASDEDSDNGNEEESDDSKDDTENEEESDDSESDTVADLGQTLKKLADNKSEEESDDSEDDNKMADLGQTLKKLADSNEDSDENESESDEDSDEESDESTDNKNINKSKDKLAKKKAVTQNALKKLNKKNALTKNTKRSRTVEVKTLDLSVLSNIGIENRMQKSETESESEDEEFFKRPNKEGKVIKKKKKNKSSFFLRENDKDNDNESDTSEESEGDENYLKRQREDSDDGNIDTGKYFRKNIYRTETGGSIEKGKGRGSFDRGRGRGFDRGGGRGFDRGRGRSMGNKRDSFNNDKRENTGFAGRGRGFSDKRRGGGRGFGERGRPDKNFSHKGNEFNANYIDIDPKNDKSKSTNVKGAGPPKMDVSSAPVHPSWAAKQKMKEQSAALNSFQGKRITFGED